MRNRSVALQQSCEGFFYTSPAYMSICFWKKRHVSFDWVKIKGDHEFAKEAKLKGSKGLFLNLGGQNRKFVKLGGPKVHFSLYIYGKVTSHIMFKKWKENFVRIKHTILFCYGLK